MKAKRCIFRRDMECESTCGAKTTGHGEQETDSMAPERGSLNR